MRETARNAVLCAADGQTRHCPAFWGHNVIGRPDRPAVDRRPQRTDFQLSSEAQRKCGDRPPGPRPTAYNRLRTHWV